ncbi:MAG: zinc ribbon domain-containing protein [Asgard group archaeon]|nr:zinc ribbon domain-containing protein [Asgard group archaeon]
MIFCPNCGEQNSEEHVFCSKCGAELKPDEKKGTIMESPRIAYETIMPTLVRRNYLLWFLYSIIISFFNAVYLYLNFEDLKSLKAYEPNKIGQILDSDRTKLIVLVVLSIFIPFIYVVLRYMKYKRLYDYLEGHQIRNYTMPSNPNTQLVVSIMMYFLSITGYVLYMVIFYTDLNFATNPLFWVGIGLLSSTVLFSIYFLVCDYYWQKALNERILMINPHAEEKLFI